MKDKQAKYPQLRFKGFTDPWEQRKFGEILNVYPFKQYIKEPESNGKYKIIQQGNEPIIGYANGKPFEEYENIVLFGDHTVSLYKPQAPFFVATDGVKILGTTKNLDGNFFNATLEKYKPQSEGYKRHFSILKKQRACFTENSDEQRRVGNFFKNLDHLITLHQRKLNGLKNVKKAMLEKMFPKNGEKVPELRFAGFADDWEQRKLGQTVTIERGGSPRPINNYITKGENGLNWVKIGDAPEEGNYITQTAEKIIPEGLPKTREVHPGDLILSNSMSFGRPYIMAIDGCIHDGWLLIRDTQNNFDLNFLCVLLGTDNMLSQYKAMAAGSTVNNLNKELVGGTTVSYPSNTEQQKIGEYFSNLDHLITLHQRKLDKLKTVKKAMLEKMFV